MNNFEDKIAAKANELLDVLGMDVEHFNKVSERFNELRSAVIKRDEKALTQLIEDIRSDGNLHDATEKRRQKIREEISIILNCQWTDVTLTKLETVLPREFKERINDKKIVLRLLSEKLKKEHVYTAKLLHECMRLNKAILNMVLNKTSETVTYNAAGSPKNHVESAILNMNF
jgi:hypothetical protein